MLRLDANHRYWNDDRQVSGVTQIIDGAGLISPFSKKTDLAERGRVVHKACQLLALGKLNWQSLDDRIRGFVESYEKLLNHTGWIARTIEMQRYCPVYDFAGTFDADFESGWLCDLKTGSPAPWHKVQLGGYWHLNGRKDRCAAIYLQENGSMARLKEVNGRDGWIEFLKCLKVRNNESSTD